MTNVEIRAIAQRETVIDKVYREVFVNNEDGCRFTVEVRLPYGKRNYFSLFAVSKPAAQREAEQRIEELKNQHGYDRIAWRIVSESKKSGWSLTSNSRSAASQQVKQHNKKESMWTRFVEYFFLPEEDEL